MKAISLLEYLRPEPEYKLCTNYLEYLPEDINWMIKKRLSSIDLFCLKMSFMEEGRSLTEDEIRDAEECELLSRMEEAWWYDYDPFDRWDYEYGVTDFTVYEDEDEKY